MRPSGAESAHAVRESSAARLTRILRVSDRSRVQIASIAVIILAVFPVVNAAQTIAADGLAPPSGPVDRLGSGHGPAWDVLELARDHVPHGASYTVRAPSRLAEMRLFMMSLGPLHNRTPHPTSYYGHPRPHEEAKARYVIVLGGDLGDPPPGCRLVAALPVGSVFRRGSGS